MTFEKMQYEHSSLKGSQKTWEKVLISWHLVLSPKNISHKLGRCVEITLEVGGIWDKYSRALQ